MSTTTLSGPFWGAFLMLIIRSPSAKTMTSIGVGVVSGGWVPFLRAWDWYLRVGLFENDRSCCLQINGFTSCGSLKLSVATTSSTIRSRSTSSFSAGGIPASRRDRINCWPANRPILFGIPRVTAGCKRSAITFPDEDHPSHADTLGWENSEAESTYLELAFVFVLGQRNLGQRKTRCSLRLSYSVLYTSLVFCARDPSGLPPP